MAPAATAIATTTSPIPQTQTPSPASPVPIVDFGPFLSASATPTSRRSVATDIDAAFRSVGFVYLTNHGIPQQEIDACFAWSKRFFALPPATKALAPHPPTGAHHRGYSAPATEKVTQHTYTSSDITSARTVPDVKESFDSGNPADERQPNIWAPEDVLPGFRAAQERFFALCAQLVHRVLEALGTALALPDERDLSNAHAASAFQLRLLHYPPVAVRALREGVKARIGAHSDFGSLTVLFQESGGEEEVGGLEGEDGEGERRWRPAPPVPGAVLVNIGDLMERWSNGRWRSTMHRPWEGARSEVDGPETDGVDGEELCAPRYSIPFFAAPDDDAVIDALPGCWGEERPKKFEAVTAREYVTMRMNALY
ncbi:uncharacterized protein K452DRAFT_223169 [Aplosporella prunicola CBS 121167]|uniref:Fe2OG dioxygenase domain-containing protein n=1 Tax=Aplosporella prunicola CBS 121167 TaxID=1176127 RepID=A0A6A6BM75_9PEZI|nr:uncharacterized protein K452DRAFT_223169 [Aplosporella prunicola CBS 121167]KAF2144384.1 hypothetical protein K452DRAFT_223169 [Aplosporella prunicola CBS 121167]